MHKTVLFGAFPRAKNRALDRAFWFFLVLSFVHFCFFWCSPSCHKSCFFWCFPSCQKSCFRSCFLAPSFVHWLSFVQSKHRALDRAFWCSPSCTKSCFLVLCFVPQIVLFGAFPCAKNRALDSRSCFLALSFVHCSPLSKHRALDRAFWCSPSCTKSCFLVLSLVPKTAL